MKLPRREREGIASATITQTLLSIAGCSALAVVTAYAADPTSWNDPSWWSNPGTGSLPAVMSEQVVTNDGLVTTNYITNQYAIVVQGQLKQFTARAVDEMNTYLPNGAGTNLNNLVQGWALDYATNDYTSTNNPYAPYNPRDFTAMNVGQLKQVGSMVWSQLVAQGYTNALPSWLAGTNVGDYTAANIGQLKTVFNFDPSIGANTVTGISVTVNSDGSISLAWTLPSGGNGNAISIAGISSSGAVTILGTVSATSTDTTLTASQASGYSSFGASNGSYGIDESLADTACSIPVADIPRGLTGSLDTNGYMNLSWQASSNAVSYEVDREILNGNNAWTPLSTTITSTNYSDTNRSLGVGYHYQVSSINNYTNSGPSASFPQPQYAVVDIGTNIASPMYINSGGAVVGLDATTGTNCVFWKDGTNYSIPLNSVVGLDNNDRVAGNAPAAPYPGSDGIPPLPPNGTIADSGGAVTWTPSAGTGTVTDPESLVLSVPINTSISPWATIGDEAAAANFCNFSYGVTALSDTTLVGSGNIYECLFDPDGFDYDTAPYYFVRVLGSANGGLEWADSPQLVGAFCNDPYDGPYRTFPSATADYEQFFPTGVNNSGVMIGTYLSYDDDGLGSFTQGYGTCDGSSGDVTLLPDDFVPSSINNSNTIVGSTSTPYGEVGTILATGQVMPVGHLPVKINNNGGEYGQILDSEGWLWSYNSTAGKYEPTNLADYFSDATAWSQVEPLPEPAALNDSGEFLATGSYGIVNTVSVDAGAKFELRDDSNVFKGWDGPSSSHGRETWTVVGTGATNNLVKLNLPENAQNLGLECVVDDTDSGYSASCISMSAVNLVGGDNNISIQGIAKTTMQSINGGDQTTGIPARIVLRSKATKRVTCTLNVIVLAPITLTVDIFYGFIPGGNSALPAGFPQNASDQATAATCSSNIISKINSYYNSQANVSFSLGNVYIITSFQANPFNNRTGLIDFDSRNASNGGLFWLSLAGKKVDKAQAHIRLFIVKGVNSTDTHNYLALSLKPNSFVPALADLNEFYITCGHEIGRDLNLSSFDPLDNKKFDYGPFPEEFLDDGDGLDRETGLLSANEFPQTPWIRREDWLEANNYAATSPLYH